MIVVVMGVCGSGKSTVGQALARRLGVAFHDADDFHPRANIDKMAAGNPLNDDDRRPWLEAMALAMSGWEDKGGAVLACSALKQSYRDLLARGAGDVRFVYLWGTREVLLQRLGARGGHFMKPAMLDSQLSALEEPSGALSINIDEPPEAIIERAVAGLSMESRSKR